VAYSSLQSDSQLVNSLLLAAVGFSINGPHTLLGLYVGEVAPEGASGAATAVSGVLGNLGNVLAGYPLTYITQKFGWSAFHSITVSFAVLILSSFLLRDTKKKKA